MSFNTRSMQLLKYPNTHCLYYVTPKCSLSDLLQSSESPCFAFTLCIILQAVSLVGSLWSHDCLPGCLLACLHGHLRASVPFNSFQRLTRWFLISHSHKWSLKQSLKAPLTQVPLPWKNCLPALWENEIKASLYFKYLKFLKNYCSLQNVTSLIRWVFS